MMASLERVCKIVLMLLFTIYISIVTLNNVLDYSSNFNFVKHVLLMDTTFKNNELMWRSISSPNIHTLFYIGLIFFEAMISILAWIGSFCMIKNYKLSAKKFHNSKKLAVISLILSLVMWSLFFMTIGGEWFLMWQSPTWNGLAVARPMFLIVGITLLFIIKKDDEKNE
ncbi:DUF2165 family protein [Silvanigrella paludirubra]|uniref:DUF2165 family protein n=1 Tax=Silvanigrella paludirubra TaxID=2499159 RepID=A0A6N6VT33_9BACT|nr:DUF2165 domain-containing protein [Silvanigrella paludirubra]KAB8039038.1 DUF2165 family protein [Silvanigrella paludirubra]